MRTVGQILKETREQKLYTLEDIEKHTKIRKELLEALEADDYEKLPPATFVRGFIKNYGRFLNLDTEKLLAIFRRGFEQSKHPDVVLESFKRPIERPGLWITPSRVITLAVVLIIVGFFSYLWVENRSYIGAPNLEVDSPRDQQTVEVPSITVSGKTDPEVKVAVNEQEIGVDSSGNFKEDINLSSTTNQIIVTATSKFGQKSTVERTVFVKK